MYLCPVSLATKNSSLSPYRWREQVYINYCSLEDLSAIILIS